MVAILAVLSGVAITALAASGQNTITIGQNTTVLGPNVMGRVGRGQWSISKANVINITEQDGEVLLDLLDKGYNVTGIRPIIVSVIDADGVVTRLSCQFRIKQVII